MRAAIVVGLSIALGACGGAAMDDVVTLQPDHATVQDMSVVSDLTAPPTSPDLTFAASCGGPADCNGDPCCAQFVKGSVTTVACTSSKSACMPMLNLATQTGMTRICTADADCTSGVTPPNDYSTCCTASGGGQSSKICFSKTLPAFSMGAVTCP